eukprot:jgi/Chrzof1/5834/Cz16g17170.t1
MGKKIKTAKGARAPDPHEQDGHDGDAYSIESDPELDSPPPPLSKATMAAVFNTSAAAMRDTREHAVAGEKPFEPGAGWKALLNVLVIFPWAYVLFLSWLVNRWQLMWRPLGGLLWWSVDQLDQRMPGLVEMLLWFHSLVSLALHVLTVGINLGVIWIMWDNGHRAVPFIIVAFYAFSHYCMAVVMFKELDLREAGGTYLQKQ